ncbi:MAG TPA: nucleotidyltransferase family protein [Acidimicrobiales bacterium]|nr:nucleotidyltransferase family protein [Acidimicrobiales bacterium]
MRPETRMWTARLLWEACRRRPDPDRVRHALGAGADGLLAAQHSTEHRIGPLLWRALAGAEALDALGPARGWLGVLAEVVRTETRLLLPRALHQALGPLADAGLEPVVLKGPTLVDRYAEPGLRAMEDIDLLLPPEHHGPALDALERAGWRVVRPARRDLYDTLLAHDAVPSWSLELHYALESPPLRVTSLEARALWAARRPIECAGVPAFGLPPAEELVVLAVHAGKPHHNFCRLVWFADLAAVAGHAAEHGEPIDWGRVRAVADAGRCATAVGAALALARFAGLDHPAELFPLPGGGWRGQALRALVDVEWPLVHQALPGYHLQYALTDDPWRRARVLAVLLASGYGVGRRARWVAGVPRRVLAGAGPTADTAPAGRQGAA